MTRRRPSQQYEDESGGQIARLQLSRAFMFCRSPRPPLDVLSQPRIDRRVWARANMDDPSR